MEKMFWMVRSYKGFQEEKETLLSWNGWKNGLRLKYWELSQLSANKRLGRWRAAQNDKWSTFCNLSNLPPFFKPSPADNRQIINWRGWGYLSSNLMYQKWVYFLKIAIPFHCTFLFSAFPVWFLEGFAHSGWRRNREVYLGRILPWRFHRKSTC